jgi:hypothetical protein
MMKLTLSAKPDVIRRAKKLAAENGTRVSAMKADSVAWAALGRKANKRWLRENP